VHQVVTDESDDGMVRHESAEALGAIGGLVAARAGAVERRPGT
jgi:hypothetical protein